MESRRLLAASPIELGTVYIEEDLGSDLHGDRFEVQFAGGAAGTELTRLIINGDRGAPGLDMNDLIFDTQPTGLGADLAAGFKVEQLISSNPSARVEAHVDGRPVGPRARFLRLPRRRQAGLLHRRGRSPVLRSRPSRM